MTDQNDELNAVKRRIRALAEKRIENGATEAEQFSAMQKVGELLERFNLTMDEVTVRQEKCVTLQYGTGSKHLGASGNCAVAIGAFTSCRVWMNRGRSEIALSFFGLESDAQMALFLCQLVDNAFETEAAKFRQSETYVNYGSHRRTLYSNFRIGFTNRVSRKLTEILNEQKRQRKEAADYHADQQKDHMIESSDSAKAEFARQTTGTALVIQEKAKYIDEEFQKLGMKLRNQTRYVNSSYHSGARDAGSKAGGRVNVNRPVGNGNSATHYLK